MLVMISLSYPSDDHGLLMLDMWNIEAPSVSAVERLVREDLAPALRRHGRQKALEQGCDDNEYCHQALGIHVAATPICNLAGLVAGLTDQRGVPNLDDAALRRCVRPRHGLHEPGQLDALLTRHGIAGPQGRRMPYRKPSINPQSSLFEDSDDDEPPF